MTGIPRFTLGPVGRIVTDLSTVDRLFGEIERRGHQINPTLLGARWTGTVFPAGPMDVLALTLQEDLAHTDLLRLVRASALRLCDSSEAAHLILQGAEALEPGRSYIAAGQTVQVPDIHAPAVVEIFCDDPSRLLSLDPATTAGMWEVACAYRFLVTAYGMG